MDDIENRAREIIAWQYRQAGDYLTAQQAESGWEKSSNPLIQSVIAALTLADKFEAQACAALEAAQIAQRRADRSSLTPDEGYVLVPVETLFDLVDDAEAHVRATEFRPSRIVHKLSSVAEAKKLLAARPEIPND